MSTADEKLVDTLLADYAEHSGVKGMKWGVRKDRGHEGERVKTKKLVKLDKQWEKTVYSMHGAIAVHNAVADKMNNGLLDRFNNDPRFLKAKGGPLADPKVKSTYLREYEKLCEKTYAEVVPQVHGVNPSGTKKAVYHPAGPDGPDRIELVDIAASHASLEEVPTLVFLLNIENGFVASVEEAASEVSHDAFVDGILSDYIAHYGIKGQKWGVRRTPKQLGKGSEDFERAFAARTKATMQGRHTLSNKELQDAITRMNLEKQYSSLASPTPAAQQFVVGLVKDVGRETLKSLLKDQVKSVIKM